MTACDTAFCLELLQSLVKGQNGVGGGGETELASLAQAYPLRVQVQGH